MPESRDHIPRPLPPPLKFLFYGHYSHAYPVLVGTLSVYPFFLPPPPHPFLPPPPLDGCETMVQERHSAYHPVFYTC